MRGEVHDYDDTSGGPRWITRAASDPATPGTQLRVGVDIGDASTADGIDPTSPEFHGVEGWGTTTPAPATQEAV